MMKAILSCTANDLYSFNLPFAVYSWHMIGVECVIFVPIDEYGGEESEAFRLGFALGWCSRVAPATKIVRFKAPADKVATYAQCSRLYGAAIPGLEADILITSDADMCVFQKDFWQQFDYNGAVNIVGSDLVPPGQYPMCYIASPLVGWRNFMNIDGRTYQQCLDALLGHLEAEHFRGNYWAKDQETVYKALDSSPFPIVRHLRASPGTQFATRRADRDGWHVTPDILDAHLPRPGYERENFIKIVHLFEDMYEEDCTWMKKYQQAFLVLREKQAKDK